MPDEKTIIFARLACEAHTNLVALSEAAKTKAERRAILKAAKRIFSAAKKNIEKFC